MKSYALRDYQQELIRQVFAHWANGRKRVLMQSGTGTGKCLVAGTPVLMFNGTVKPVEQIVTGDVIMGDDSTPRTVLSTCAGREQLYDIVPVKGEKWGCNESHILSLVCNGNSGRFKRGQVYDISVREYLMLSKTDRHVLKQYRVGVTFQRGKALHINPYFLGLWLGDGNSRSIAITNPDPEVIRILKASGYGVRNMEKRQGKCPTWLFPAGENERLYSAFREHDLFKNKHIPPPYLTASRHDRMELLAGLLDTNGHLSQGVFEITAKSANFAKDILFLARSLGLAAYNRVKLVKLKGWETPRPYNRISISGDVSAIPCLVIRKQAGIRNQIKNHLRTGFDVVPKGEGQYYGFEIDGNRRFVLGDFTVTHNTVMFNHIVNLAQKKGKRVLVIADRRELIHQAWQRLWDAHGIHAGIILSGQTPAYQLPVQIASVQTLNRRSFPPDIDLVVIDECRASVSPSYAPIFEQYKDAHFLGVDATPIRTSGQGFDHLYDELVVGPSIKQMELAGALVPAKPFINPINQSALDKISVTAGDYNEKELARVMSDEKLTADLVASKTKWAPGLKTIVFAVNIEHSKMIIEQYRRAGIPARHIDGEAGSEDRAQVFRDFKNGKIEVLCNVGIATYGFDEPSIMAVQLARPTMSLALYLQMIGRGARPYQNKDHYILLDHANCIMDHGLPNAERKWSLKGKPKIAKGKTYAVLVDGQKKLFAGKDLPKEMEGAVLEEVDEETLAYFANCKKFDKIRERQMRSGYKPLWAFFQYVQKHPDCIGLNELRYIGQQLGFKPGWGYMKFQEFEEKKMQLVEKS